MASHELQSPPRLCSAMSSQIQVTRWSSTDTARTLTAENYDRNRLPGGWLPAPILVLTVATTA